MEYNRGKTPASGVRGRTPDKTRQDKTKGVLEVVEKYQTHGCIGKPNFV